MFQTLVSAQQRAWNLATTLMVSIILFKTEDGFGVMPTAEFDGETDSIVYEYDPFES